MNEYTAEREIETPDGEYKMKEVTFEFSYTWDWSDGGELSPSTEIEKAYETDTQAPYIWTRSDEDEVQEWWAENVEYPTNNFDLLCYG